MNPATMAMVMGLVLLVLLLLAILTGTKVIKADIKTHRLIAFTLLGMGVLHAASGVLRYFGLMPR